MDMAKMGESIVLRLESAARSASPAAAEEGRVGRTRRPRRERDERGAGGHGFILDSTLGCAWKIIFARSRPKWTARTRSPSALDTKASTPR